MGLGQSHLLRALDFAPELAEVHMLVVILIQL